MERGFDGWPVELVNGAHVTPGSHFLRCHCAAGHVTRTLTRRKISTGYSCPCDNGGHVLPELLSIDSGDGTEWGFNECTGGGTQKHKTLCTAWLPLGHSAHPFSKPSPADPC